MGNFSVCMLALRWVSQVIIIIIYIIFKILFLMFIMSLIIYLGFSSVQLVVFILCDRCYYMVVMVCYAATCSSYECSTCHTRSRVSEHVLLAVVVVLAGSLYLMCCVGVALGYVRSVCYRLGSQVCSSNLIGITVPAVV